MFEKWDPRKKEILSILDENGDLKDIDPNLPIINDQEVLRAFKLMILAREADEWAVALNRQGRLATYAPNKGQEANSIASLMALNHDDWFVQAFRELGGLLVREVPLQQWYITWYGNEIGNQFPLDKYHILPVSVPIASQMLHAVGLGYAEKLYRKKRVVISFVGDGGTSEGDFYEAINFAGSWNTPNIFYIQNNQWAISVPRRMQTAAPTLAEKAFAAGIEGIQVDGNDLFAVYAATKMAAEKARKGEGPTLIEGYTYRLGAHTTADDPTRYRKESEVSEWAKKDPIIRLEKYLLNKKLIDANSIHELKESAKQKVRQEFEAVEKHADPTLEDTFRYTYKEMPEILHEQMERIKARTSGGER